MDLVDVQAQLKQRNEEFKVLTEQFLKQRKELFAAKKIDSNREYVNGLEEKLKNATLEIAELKKEKEEKAAEKSEIVLKVKEMEEEKCKRNEESYSILVQIDLLFAEMNGSLGEMTNEEFTECKEKMMAIVKNEVSPDRISELSEDFIIKSTELARKKISEMRNLTKEFNEAKSLADSYKEKAVELEDKLRFESIMTQQIQEKVNVLIDSLEYHKKLVAELKSKKKEMEENEELYEESDEDEDDDEEFDESDSDEEDLYS